MAVELVVVVPKYIVGMDQNKQLGHKRLELASNIMVHMAMHYRTTLTGFDTMRLSCHIH